LPAGRRGEKKGEYAIHPLLQKSARPRGLGLEG